jgi:Domain of Unknown Function (DUF1080)
MAVVLLSIATQTLSAKDEWVNLFNGRNLAGWTQKAGYDKFFVEDGCIVGQAVTGDDTGNDTNSVLATKKKYGNFILELDFKDDHCLFSGVHVRSALAVTNVPVEWGGGLKAVIPSGHVYGYLVMIDPSPVKRWWTCTLYDQRWWSGGIYDERRRLWLYPGDLGGNPDEFSMQGKRIFRANDWNHFRIECVGDSITTYLNGTRCAHINDSMNLNGFIGLQVRSWISDDTHETLTGSKVRFKNIRLLALDPKLGDVEF